MEYLKNITANEFEKAESTNMILDHHIQWKHLKASSSNANSFFPTSKPATVSSENIRKQDEDDEPLFFM